jgi:hypothetical protein
MVAEKRMNSQIDRLQKLIEAFFQIDPRFQVEVKENIALSMIEIQVYFQPVTSLYACTHMITFKVLKEAQLNELAAATAKLCYDALIHSVEYPPYDTSIPWILP